MKPVFMTYKKNDITNFIVLMALGFIAIPMFVSSDYWFTLILITWLCLALAPIRQQIVMGYTGQHSLGAAGFMAAGAFACFNIVLRIPDLPFFGALIGSGSLIEEFNPSIGNALLIYGGHIAKYAIELLSSFDSSHPLALQLESGKVFIGTSLVTIGWLFQSTIPMLLARILSMTAVIYAAITLIRILV